MNQEEEKPEFNLTISGKMVYDIYLKEKSFDAKYQVCNENNLIALMMVKEILTYLVERNSNPNIPKSEKKKGKEFARLCESALVVGELAEELSSFIIKEGLAGKYKPEIIKPAAPKIITL